MLTKTEAKRLFENQIPEDGRLNYERTHLLGWAFGYQSKKYLESRDVRDMWIGTGVTLINRFTGNVRGLGSHGPPSDLVLRYQLKWFAAIGFSLYLLVRGILTLL